MAAPVFNSTAAFRVSLVCGQRDAQVWTLRRQPTPANPEGMSMAAIAERFGLTRQRIEQVMSRADRRLETWPEPNEWQRTLPARLRELCALGGFTSPAKLVDVILGNHLPKHWTIDDVKRITSICAIDMSNRSVGDAIDSVVSDLEQMRPRIEALVEAGVDIAPSLAYQVRVFVNHARKTWDSLQRSKAIAHLNGEPT